MNFLRVILLLSIAVGNEAQRHRLDRPPTLTRRWNCSFLSHSDCGIEWIPLKPFTFAEAFIYEPWIVRTERIFKWNRLGRRPSQFTPRRRVLGGQDNRNGQFPWTARLTLDQGWWRTSTCTSSLLTTRFVLTAAHCVVGLSSSKIQVHVGVDPPNHNHLIQLSVVNFFVHPCYRRSSTSPVQDSRNCRNTNIDRADIALIQIDSTEPVKHDNQPNSWYRYNTVCLSTEPPSNYSARELFLHEVFNVSGWGMIMIGDDQQQAEHLQWNEYSLHSMSRDRSTLFLSTFANSTLCQGDSGSPLVVQNSNGRWFQVGVHSGGNPYTVGSCNYGMAFATNINHPVNHNWIVSAVRENTPNLN